MSVLIMNRGYTVYCTRNLSGLCLVFLINSISFISCLVIPGPLVSLGHPHCTIIQLYRNFVSQA